MRVVVAGTIFGQVYLEGVRGHARSELAGILARGSERSRACADRYGVPLYTSPDELPDDVDAACVVVRSRLLGGGGTDLALALMARGIHVLQEHPLHRDELAECLRAARAGGVTYHLNPFYRHLDPVRRFAAAVHELLRTHPPLYVDAACGFQVAYALLDVLAGILGKLRPWTIRPPAADAGDTFRSVAGTIAGVPLTLRIQNELDPADPDNHAHLLHRITVGTAAGALMLVDTHGPIVWAARPRFPREVRSDTAQPHYEGGGVATDAPPSTEVLGPVRAPRAEALFASMWPEGVGRALDEFEGAVERAEDPLRRGGRDLACCALWQEISAKLGPPKLIDAETPPQIAPGVFERIARAAGYGSDVA